MASLLYTNPAMLGDCSYLFRSKRHSFKYGQSRREERSLVNPNERRVTPTGCIWGVAPWDRLFLHPAALFPDDVHQAHHARNTLQDTKMAVSLRSK